MPQPSYPVKQIVPPLPPRETLPTMYDLPSENPEEPGLPDEYHDLQPQLLSQTLRSPCYLPERVFTGGDLNLYYDVRHTQWYKRPDWFLVVGVSRQYEEKDLRSSYVVWQEGVNPFVVVELLSPGTAKEDLGDYAEADEQEEQGETGTDTPVENTATKETPARKWDVYEQILRVPYYIVFSRYTNHLRFFQLVGGHYQEQALNPDNPRIWIPELEVGLGLWQGEYAGITRLWLRWYDEQGNWIPTDAEQERQRAEQAESQLQQVVSQLEQIVLNLLQQGMTVAQVAQITGFPEQQVQRLSEESGT